MKISKKNNHYLNKKIIYQPEIPWGHNTLILSKSKTVEDAYFYISETLENGWSIEVLELGGNLQ